MPMREFQFLESINVIYCEKISLERRKRFLSGRHNCLQLARWSSYFCKQETTAGLDELPVMYLRASCFNTNILSFRGSGTQNIILYEFIH